MSAPALDIGLDIEVVPVVLLAIDVGNTQTVIGLFGTDDEHRGRRHRRRARPARPLAHRHLRRAHQRRAGPARAGVPRLPRLQLRRGRRRRGAVLVGADRSPPPCARWPTATSASTPSSSSPASRPACRSCTRTPRRSAPTASPTPSAAYDLYGGPTIVVDFGTATTLEAISAKGEYLGGAILPGIEISLDALFGRAAALRKVELVEPRSVIGKNTIESIQSGALYGFAAQVDGICAPHGGRDRRGDGRRHRRPGRRHRAVLRRASRPRAVADPARPAPHLREEPEVTRPHPVPVRASTPRPPTLHDEFAAPRARHRDRRTVVRRRPAHAAAGPGQARLRHAAGLAGPHPAVRAAQRHPGLRASSARCRSATGSASAAS